MSRLPGHGAFGLRGRIVGVVLVTAVATLAVAALALLGPLEQSLRNVEKTTLRTQLSRKGALSMFERRLSLGTIAADPVDRSDLLKAQQGLVRRLNARFVDVLQAPGSSADILAPTHDPSDQDDPFNDVRAAFATNRPQYTFGFVDGQPVKLTFSEFELLDALMADPGRLLNRQELLRAIWGDSAYRDPRAIDVHIRHLREKLERDAKDPEYLFTVRGVGYRFRDRERGSS